MSAVPTFALAPVAIARDRMPQINATRNRVDCRQESLVAFVQELVAGLLIAHVIWAIFYGAGTLVLTSVGGDGIVRGPRHPLDVSIRTACGAAAFTFAIFILGALGALKGGVLVALGAGLPAVLFCTSARKIGIRRTLDELGMPWATRDVFAGIIYIVAVVCFPPALLAPVDFDPGMYHLAHAVNWAHSGRIYVDEYLRFPLFAYNTELLYASMFALGLHFYVQVIDWLAFAWSALALYALTLSLLAPKLQCADPQSRWIERRYANVLALLATLVYCASPVILRYADTGYVDIAIGFFFMAMIGAAIRAIEGARGYAFGAAVIAGSLIGMKEQFATFVPLIGIGLLYIAAIIGAGRKTVAIWFATFAIIGAPWYLRNVLVSGDPISPVLNLALNRPDPFWSKQDYVSVVSALHAVRVPTLLAPFLQFLHPDAFAELGASLNTCFIYVPVVVVPVLVWRRRLRENNRPFFIACATTAYAICVIYGLSQYFRYSIEFFGAYLAVLTTLIVALSTAVTKKFIPRARIWATVAASVGLISLMALPSPAGMTAFSGMTGRFNDIGDNVTHPRRYFAASVPEYPDTVDVSDIINASGKSGTVLTFALENLAYVFRDRNIVSLGDWFGPARYSDLEHIVGTPAVAKYFRHFHVAAVMIGSRDIGFSKDEMVRFVQQVRGAGYTELMSHDPAMRTFIRADVLKAALASGYRNDLLTSYLESRQLSVAFIDVFGRGRINSDRPAGTPTGRGALLLQWPSVDSPYSTITVLSGYAYTFRNIRLGRRPVLMIDVAKPISAGSDALAWVDVTPVGGKTRRIVSNVCRPAFGTQPSWQHLSVSLPENSVNVSITFGASSLSGNNSGDWIAFAHPVLEQATVR